MRRHWNPLSVLASMSFAAALIAFAMAIAFHPTPAAAGGTTCATKHCPANTHCCPGCTGNAICVKGGIRCPECAPQ